jgi:uncharacterized protein YwgA
MVKKFVIEVEERQIPKLSIKDWVLVKIYKKEERRPRNPVSLMNEIFIFIHEVVPSIKDDFEFKSMYLGPYSVHVAEAVKQLVSMGMMEIEVDKEQDDNELKFTLTDEGAKKAKIIATKLPVPLREKLDFMNTTTSHMGPYGMLQYIQSIYPEYVFLKKDDENNV